jgi:hypothetical protein
MVGRLALPYNNLQQSAGTPLIGYERWHCLHKGKPEVLDDFYATPNPFDPCAALGTARWAMAHCLEPPSPSEMAGVDRLALGGGGDLVPQRRLHWP